MLTHRVSFGLDPALTCLLQTDLLSTFQREFGVGTALVPDTVRGEPVDIPLERGWARHTLTVPRVPGRLIITRTLSNGLQATASGSSYEKCLPNVEINDHRRLQQSR